MKKELYPILEFDENEVALINPKELIKEKQLPDKLVICFFREVINSLVKSDDLVFLRSFYSEGGPANVYRFKDKNIAVAEGSLGAPASVGFLEEYIAAGANEIIFCGSAGVLDKEIQVGHLVLVSSAIRDEGTSYHYLQPAREVETDFFVMNKISEFLKKHKVPFIIGKTWTTDAFYRETKEKIALRKTEGAITVEMEQSAMIAVCKFRKVKYGALLYGGDDVSQEFWDSRDWKRRVDVRENMLYLCREYLLQND